jgi:hypothetical protein
MIWQRTGGEVLCGMGEGAGSVSVRNEAASRQAQIGGGRAGEAEMFAARACRTTVVRKDGPFRRRLQCVQRAVVDAVAVVRLLESGQDALAEVILCPYWLPVDGRDHVSWNNYEMLVAFCTV